MLMNDINSYSRGLPVFADKYQFLLLYECKYDIFCAAVWIKTLSSPVVVKRIYTITIHTGISSSKTSINCLWYWYRTTAIIVSLCTTQSSPTNCHRSIGGCGVGSAQWDNYCSGPIPISYTIDWCFTQTISGMKGYCVYPFYYDGG